MPTLPQGYTVQLGWNTIVSGSPRIRLYLAAETNGGVGYLTSSAVSSNQLAQDDFPFPANGISVGNPATLPGSIFFTGFPFHFVFEAGAVGKGELMLTVLDGSNVVASTSAWLDLHDVGDFYERAIITNMTAGAVSNWSSSISLAQQPAVYDEDDGQDVIIYVHGASNAESTWRVRSETTFKRLYWAGFHGRFSSVRWPSIIKPELEWFNYSEHSAYVAARSFSNYLGQLRGRLPDAQIHILAHSQGGAIASEALSQGGTFDTLILSQVAMPASCYDINAPTNADLVARDVIKPTPEWKPLGYRGAHTNISGRIVNYFNPEDALLKLWLIDQKFFKPGDFYSFDGTNAWFLVDETTGFYRQVTDPQESRAMIARARTLGIGAQGPTANQSPRK